MSNDHSLLIITGSYPPRNCGIADYTQTLAQTLSANGIEVTVLAPQAPDRDALPAVVYEQITSTQALWRTLRIVKELKPGIVHLQYQIGIYGNKAPICYLPLILRLCSKSRVITTFHDLNGPPSWGRFHRIGALLMLAGSHAAVVCSNKQLSGLKRLPLLDRKIKQISVGPSVTPASSIQHSNLRRTGPIKVLHFGFVWRNRGLESVVSAVAAAKKAGHCAELTFAGGIIEITHCDELRQLGADLGLSDEQIIFTDNIPVQELSKTMQESDFCILPFPTGVSTGRSTFASCAAHGLPMVTTYNPDNCPEELKHGENILLYEYGNEEKLAELVVLLCSDSDLRQKLGTNIRSAMRCMGWPSIAAEHRQLYSQLYKATN